MFRNLRCYRITSPWPDSEQELSERLSEREFAPCSAYSEKSAGWEAPDGTAEGSLGRRLAGADLIQLRTQSRVLPVAAVKEALEVRVAEYRSRMEQDPPRGELRRLREQTRDELIPKALVKSERHRACFIQSESLLAIDVGTVAKAEWFIDQLRSCFPQFRCAPLTFNQSPVELMSRIFLGEQVKDFALGRECRMQDQMDSKSIATWRDIDLGEPSIRKHVTDGMKLTHLGVEYQQLASFVLGDDGVISKFRLAENEEADSPDNEDPIARLDADFVMLSATARRLMADLKQRLGGYASLTGA